MKLAFSTLGAPDWPFEEMLSLAQRLGVTGLEVRGIQGVMRCEELPQFFPENAEKTLKEIAAYGLTPIVMGTSAAFHTPEAAQKGLAEAKAAIDTASACGIGAIRVFGNDLPQDVPVEQTAGAVAGHLKALCAYAQEKQVQVLLEIHGQFNTILPVGIVIEQLKGEKAFGIIWDVAHSDRSYKDQWKPFYELIKPYIRHIHIKDHTRHDTGNVLCLPGAGDIPILNIVRTLKADGYDGYYSLEWEKKWHPELEPLDKAMEAFVRVMQEADKA